MLHALHLTIFFFFIFTLFLTSLLKIFLKKCITILYKLFQGREKERTLSHLLAHFPNDYSSRALAQAKTSNWELSPEPSTGGSPAASKGPHQQEARIRNRTPTQALR